MDPTAHEWLTLQVLFERVLDAKHSLNTFKRRNAALYEVAFLDLLERCAEKPAGTFGAYTAVLIHYNDGNYAKVEELINCGLKIYKKHLGEAKNKFDDLDL